MAEGLAAHSSSEPPPLSALALSSSDAERSARYAEVRSRLALLLEGERDWVAAMATTACELHEAFAYYHWTGWYRAEGVRSPSILGPRARGRLDLPSTLVVGPYQGSLGCLRIPFARGVCGAAARLGKTQLVPEVHAFPGHIACASSTQSEVVVPLFAARWEAAQEETKTNRRPEECDAANDEEGGKPSSPQLVASLTQTVAAVLDVDSDHPDAFREVDAKELEELCRWLSERRWD